MFRPWITLKSENVHINLPLNMEDRNIDIMFRNLESVEDAITQLERVREMYLEKDGRNFK